MNTWILTLPFEMQFMLSKLGVRYDASLKECVYLGEKLPAHLEMFKAQPFSLGWSKQYYKNGRHLEPLKPVAPRFLARSHQKLASKTVSNANHSGSPGFLVADEVGVGKTMSAWDFALTEKTLKTVLIATTSAAQAHWRNTVLHAGWRLDQRIVIINYEQLGKLFAEPEGGLSSSRKKGKRKRLANQGTAPSFDLVIFDESHKGKNPTSARGILMRKIEKKAKFCVYASATAGQNPVELVYLSSLLSFKTGKKIPSTTIEDFVEWCKSQGLNITRGAYGKIVWERNKDDLETIHDWLFGGTTPLAIRRLPEDIADWPKMQRQLQVVDLDPLARSAYAKIWDDFVREDIRAADTPKTKSILQEKNRMRLRQESSWLRIKDTVDIACNLIEQGKKVAVSVAFKNVQEEMIKLLEAKKIEANFINGSQSAHEKEEARLSFQKGSSDAIIFTVEEAISLHEGEYLKTDKPRVLLVHDIRWSAIQMAQIEGRCHRDGKLAPVMWLAASDTVDVDIASRMIEKVQNMKSMHGDDLSDTKDIEDILKKYAKGH